MPLEAILGDEIWIIHGFQVLIAARLVGLNRYRLLGISFVYGMMNREAMAYGRPEKDVIVV